MLKVLSIDGGGAWGIGVAKYLAQWECKHGKNISCEFSAFAGTSTGAIIAALLAEGFSGIEIYDLYKKYLPKMFSKQPWYQKFNIYKPTYDNTYLKKMLKETLIGNIGAWSKPIFIPTCSSTGNEEKIFDAGDKDYPKWKAVLASASAPTYFDPLDYHMFDGGLAFNNPSDILQAGLVDSDMHGRYKMVSFCTGGRSLGTKKLKKMTLVKWGSYLMRNWLVGSGEASAYRTKKNIGEKNYLRIYPIMTTDDKEIGMDDIKKSKRMEEIWMDTYDTTSEIFHNFINEVDEAK